jgi:hypothetical protein
MNDPFLQYCFLYIIFYDICDIHRTLFSVEAEYRLFYCAHFLSMYIAL